MDSQIVIQTVMASSPPMNIGVRASVVDRRNDVEVVRDVEREPAQALGVDMDDVLCRLRADGATIIECVKVVREIEAMHLGRAKEIVDASTAWADRFAENDDLRTTAIEGIERENDG